MKVAQVSTRYAHCAGLSEHDRNGPDPGCVLSATLSNYIL